MTTSKVFRITATIEVPTNIIVNALTDALEQGSTHWLLDYGFFRHTKTGISTTGVKLGLLDLFERSGLLLVASQHDERIITVTNETVFAGLKKLAEYPKTFWAIATDNSDSHISDVFFQVVCFGDYIYA